MDPWILLSLICVILIKIVINSTKNRKLPPGPYAVLIVAKILWLKRSIFEIGDILRQLHLRYGPIITLRITSQPAIIISDRRLAHEALVQKGASFANRPLAVDPELYISSNQHEISTSFYGPLWRVLRRNFVTVLHPTNFYKFAPTRKFVLSILLDRLRAQATTNASVVIPLYDIEYSIYCLLILMCFGILPEESVIRDIAEIEKYQLETFTKFNVFEFFPTLTKVVFSKWWNEIVSAQRRLAVIFLSMIKEKNQEKYMFEFGTYVDSLLGLMIPEREGMRKLSEGEMVSLCSEFVKAGTDTVTTALQWVMAELVRHPEMQRKLAEEVEGIVGSEAEMVREEYLAKMPYLKAVVKEGLRRHPPTHFVLPHAVTEEVELGGYMIPKDATVNFLVAEIGWDGELWDEPMEFRPERFLAGGEGEGVDLTGSREIKMMPFGAGRRICPGLGLAMLQLEYFVANLVREFEWKPVKGEQVDMAEKIDFTVMMKKPLRAGISARRSKCIGI